MSPKIFKWSKFTIVLAVVALCCFMFAGAALAAQDFSIYGGNNPVTGEPTNVVKAAHTYDYTIVGSGLNIDLNLFCEDDINSPPLNQLIIDFPFDQEMNNLDELQGKTIPVYVTVGGNNYLVPVVPTDVLENTTLSNSSVVDRVYLTIERQAIPTNGKVTDLKIEGLRVLNPDQPGSGYCVNLSHTQGCFQVACLNLNVVETVGEIGIDSIYGCPVGGSKITVAGHLNDTLGNPWHYTTWPVIVEFVSTKSVPTEAPCNLCPPPSTTYTPASVNDPTKGPFVSSDCLPNQLSYYINQYQNPVSGVSIAPVVTHANNGYFEASITVPAVPGTYRIIARTVEVKDNQDDLGIEYTFTTADYLVPAEAIEDRTYLQEPNDNHYYRGIFHNGLEQFEHAWVLSDPESVIPLPGDPKFITLEPVGSQVDCNNCTELTIVLRDKYGIETTNAIPCGVDLDSLKVDLKAFFIENGVEKLYGRIHDGDCNGPEIDHVFIAPGESKAYAYFKPDKGGYVSIQASTIISGTPKVAKICNLEVNCGYCMIEITPLVECYDSGNARAGWPVKVSVHYNPKLPGTVLANNRTTADLRVELLNSALQPVSDATWDTVAKLDGDRLAFDVAGSKQSGNTYTHPGGVSYDPIKSDFYVYVPKNFCDQLTVKIVDPEVNVYDTESISYTSPTELVRVLSPNKWQLLSTPKELAGAGTMTSLLGGVAFSDMLVYDKNAPNGPWVQVTDAGYKLRPQYGYLLNMKQNWSNGDPCTGPGCGSQNCIQANYVYTRATGPALPGQRPLNLGWNLVGSSFDENLPEQNGEQIPTEYRTISTPCPASFSCNCDAELTQGDNLSRMLGSACADCKALVNWGGKGLNGEVQISMSSPYGKIIFSGSPNQMGNLGNFTSATVNNGTLGGWGIDPTTIYGFNGDAYWLYISSPQTLTSNTMLDVVDIQP